LFSDGNFETFTFNQVVDHDAAVPEQAFSGVIADAFEGSAQTVLVVRPSTSSYNAQGIISSAIDAILSKLTSY
jgi:hypothetical protein